MLLKWGGYRGERWRWHSEQQAYFRFCKDCHLEAWPEDSGPNPALAQSTATAAAATTGAAAAATAAAGGSTGSEAPAVGGEAAAPEPPEQQDNGAPVKRSKRQRVEVDYAAMAAKEDAERAAGGAAGAV